MNTKTKNVIKTLFIAGLIPLFSGCTISNSDGGFFRSVDGGTTFTQETTESGSILTGKKILSLEINPSNDKEIFVGTLSSGLFKTIDEGKTWLTDANNFQSIYDIKLIPNTQVIYMAAKKDGRGKLFKSDNNGEAWIEVYTEKDETSFLTSIAFHNSELGSIYIANSKGGLFKSEDGGASWKNLYWANSLIRKIEIDKINPNIIYLATNNSGLWMSKNKGIDFEAVINGGYVYNVVAHPSQEGFVYASTAKGVQKSLNKGADWISLNTLVKANEAVSPGLAINPNNPKEIFYTAGKTFYKSINEGETWMPVQFSTGASIELIKINPNNSQLIYLGTNKVKTGLKLGF